MGKILKVAKLGDLLIEQPTKFELVSNEGNDRLRNTGRSRCVAQITE